ncbi:MarR family winged helix-turn-helix transcriptional regulator [Arthrobacter sp. 2YAF22_2]|uniref:MarR family winged helix-turn-helix transcriptional regulator n=1 Tax=Arthrobacter sp. 2YAF22_2 TaxID=3233029 RepID=UPI003F8D92E5
MATDVDEQPGIRPADKLMSASISRDAGFLLAKLHAAGSVLNNRALAQFGLKERSYSVLALATSELEPTQREMAEFLSLDPSQIVALIDELEQRGLVIRAPGRLDRRAKIVSATEDGSAVFRQAEAAARAAESTALANLTDAEAGELKGLLRKALWSRTA